MSNRRRIVSNYFLFPILCIVIYFAIIFLAATSVAVFVGEDYMEHEGKIYFLEGILGLGVLITWIMMKKAMGKEIPPMPGSSRYSTQIYGAMADTFSSMYLSRSGWNTQAKS